MEDNVFDGQSTSGVSLAVRDRHFTVRGNRFRSTVAAAVGISIGNSTAGFNISGNQVQMLSKAMLLSGSIQATTGEPRIYNNMLYSASAGGLIVGTSSATGLRIDNNSVWCNTYALHYLSGTTTTASLRNNILVRARAISRSTGKCQRPRSCWPATTCCIGGMLAPSPSGAPTRTRWPRCKPHLVDSRTALCCTRDTLTRRAPTCMRI